MIKRIIGHGEATNSDRSHLASLGFDPDRPIKHEIIGVEHHLSQEEVTPTIEEGERKCELKETTTSEQGAAQVVVKKEKKAKAKAK
jgi:hypothetical protein